MVEEMPAEEVSELLRQSSPGVMLLDVREHDERATARIEPSLHIPMNEVPRRLAEIPGNRRIVVYCHHGGRSALVASFLEARGYHDVVNLSGGIDDWSLAVDPRVPRY